MDCRVKPGNDDGEDWVQADDTRKKSTVTRVIRDTAVSVASSPSPRHAMARPWHPCRYPTPVTALGSRSRNGMDYRDKPGNDAVSGWC